MTAAPPAHDGRRRTGRPAIAADAAGTFLTIPHPTAAEVLAQTGFDFLIADTEHISMGPETTEYLIRAADVHGVPTMVRLPGQSEEAIVSALNAGAAGIFVSRVSSAAEAAAAVAATRFPPRGRRGVGPVRAAGFGAAMQPYLAADDEGILVAAQIGTAEGVADISAIAATDGIDVVFIGPTDLRMALGTFGTDDDRPFDAAVAAILAACRAAGCAAGIFCARAEEVETWRERGFRFFIVGSDAGFMSAAAAASISALSR